MTIPPAESRSEAPSRAEQGLRAWRDRVGADADARAEARAALEAARQRRRQLGGALSLAGVVGLVGVVVLAQGRPEVPHVSTPGPMPELSPELAIPAAPADEAPPETLPQPVPAPVALALDVREVSTWFDGSTWWLQADYGLDAPVTLEWLDAAGKSVLEPRTCAGRLASTGLRRCFTGRSLGRVRAALAQGATPGEWTVRACVDGTCADLATLVVDPG